MAEYEELNGGNNRSSGQGSAQRLSCIPCTDPAADTTTPGCCDPTQSNYDPLATCDDGSCQPFTYGCMDPTADNYNSTITSSDGSCIWLGCLNPTASNYMGYTIPFAGILPGPYFGGTDWGIAIDDGSCVDGGDWSQACTDPTAINYDPSCAANPICYSCFQDTCCIYPDPDVLGCTAPTADNYDPLANVDDGSCFLSDCTDPNAVNYSGYNNGDPYTFPNGVTGVILSDNTLCEYTEGPGLCTIGYAQVVAENIIWNTGRWNAGALTGTQASLWTWVENHWYQPTVGYNTGTPHPCKWFETMVNKFTNQISDHFAGIPPYSNWGPNLLAKKQAILEYFIEMQRVCDCVEDEPTVFKDCFSIIVDQNRYFKYEHDTDTTTVLTGTGAGTGSIHNSDQPYDVAMVDNKFYAIIEHYDEATNTVDWIIREYMVNWSANTYIWLRDIVANNAIQDIPLAYTMKDANTMLVMTQGTVLYPKQAIVAIDITTNIAPAVGTGGTAIVVDWINFPFTLLNQGGDITYYDDDTMLVSFHDSDIIKHYYVDTVNGYFGAGPISNATVPSIYGVAGHYIFDDDTYIITVNSSGVNEVRKVTVPSFTTGGFMVISPVLPNVIPSTQFIRGADTGCYVADSPCDVGMDVVFILDYTSSMTSAINSVINGVSTLVNTIDTLTGYGNYRLGLVTADEYMYNSGLGAFPPPNYDSCPDYQNLPAAQRMIAYTSTREQVITAWEMMDLGNMNNGASFTSQIQLLAGGGWGWNCVDMGYGANNHEPCDFAAQQVVNNNFTGTFRPNVANYIVIVTDNLPSGQFDNFNTTVWAGIQAMIVQAQADGISYFVCGPGANDGVWLGGVWIQPYIALAMQTGGNWTNSYNTTVISNMLIASCTD
jgi:hypothetical protein